MRREGVWAIVGALLLVAGLMVGYIPVHSSSGEDCGSPFASKIDQLRLSGDLAQLGSVYSGNGTGNLGFGDAVAECESKHNSTRPIAILLLVLGGVGLIAAAVSYRPTGREDGTPPAATVD